MFIKNKKGNKHVTSLRNFKKMHKNGKKFELLQNFEIYLKSWQLQKIFFNA